MTGKIDKVREKNFMKKSLCWTKRLFCGRREEGEVERQAHHSGALGLPLPLSPPRRAPGTISVHDSVPPVQSSFSRDTVRTYGAR